MKTLTIDESFGQRLVLFSTKKSKTLITCPLQGATWLDPDNLLKVRDWINERCRELQFQGHLPEHLGD